MPIDPLLALILFMVVGFAAFVKGFVGFGMPLIAVPILALVLDPKTVIVAFAIPMLFSNLIVMLQGRVPWGAVRRGLPFIVTLMVGALAGAALLPRLDARLVALVLGSVSLVFALLSLVHVRVSFSPGQERIASPLLGAACGVLGGATTIYGPIAALYLQALKYDKWAFVYVLSVMFWLAAVIQNATFWALQLYQPDTLLYGLLMCVPMFLGVRLGLWLHHRTSATWFHYLVLVVVLLSSLNLIARGLGIGG
jgi:hypothetical protein